VKADNALSVGNAGKAAGGRTVFSNGWRCAVGDAPFGAAERDNPRLEKVASPAAAWATRYLLALCGGGGREAAGVVSFTGARFPPAYLSCRIE